MVSINKKRVIKSLCAAAFLGALIIYPQSSFAEVPVPTLDRVKAENTTFINSLHPTYELTQLTDDTNAPEGSITVKIDDTSYYYTPTENTDVLKSLASTGSVALEETTDQSKAFYSTPDGKYYTYNPDKLKDSSYTLTEAASADEPNTITLYEKQEVIKYYDPTTGLEVAESDRQEGVDYKEVTTIETTPKYYTVSLKQTEYGDKTADSAKPIYFKWTTGADGNKQFTQEGTSADDYSIVYYMQTEYGDKNHSSEQLYFEWQKEGDNNKFVSATESDADITYYVDDTRSFASSRITTDQNGANINQNFRNLNVTTSSYGSANGGAIDNEYGDATIGDITGDFIGNYAYASAYNADVNGGAIYNSDSIGNITGDFIGNYATTTNTTSSASPSTDGGAIYNGGTIGDITGDFIGNYASSTSSYVHGGAIYNNDGTIGDITGDFIGNYSTQNGGAIYNGGTIGGITGDFIGNYAFGSGASGGAIYNNDGTIGDITGDFIGNYASSTGASANGGAILNYYEATIGDITGDFIGNYVSSSSSVAYGGAIYNYNNVTIGDITGDFIGNYVSTTDDYAYGGAIYNSGSNGTIGNITGDFIGNYVSSSSSFAYGGAIYNVYYATIGDITGDFIGNYASSTGASASGGAIYNYVTIGDITGDFIGNYVSGGRSASGGAIHNFSDAEIGNITGDFIGNYVSSSSSVAEGGAIYNYYGTIGDITGNFIGNYASSTNSSANGGAIYNRETIGDITGDFIGNYTYSTSYNAEGGAIYNYYGTIGDITGNFIGNYVTTSGESSSADGGAIYNYNNVTIGNITGDFIGNYASATSDARGGAIYNYETIGDITGDFIGNYTYSTSSSAQGGAIYNYDGTIGDITGDFIGNHAFGRYASGGVIYNSRGTIGDITGNFIGNYASSTNSSAYGGAIYNTETIGDITGDFIGNYASGNSYAYGGAIYNSGSNATIGNITGDFIGNYVQSKSSYALGGAIYNYISSSTSKATIGFTNNNFLNNYAKSETGTAKGGAIFTSYDLTLNADNGDVLISGNYTESNGVKENNAIYVANLANSSGTIQRNTTFTLNAINNGKIQIEDTIAGGSYYSSSYKFWETSDHAYTLALTGDGTGTISLYNDIKNANVTSDNVTIDFANGETRDYNFVSMTAGENTNLNLDVDFSNKTADTITTQNNSTGTLVINSINELGSSDGPITVQIIKNTNSSSTLQLALGDNITEVTEEFVFDQNYVEHTDKFIQEGGMSLATTNTTNDSLTIIQEKFYDTLQLINSYQTDEERTFQFADSSKYTLSEDLNPTTAGVLNINGVSVSAPSTLDANAHTLFNLQNETTLNIKNTTIENAKDYAIKAEHENAVVNLTNTSVKNTTTDTPDINKAAIQSKVDLNITADAGKSEFSGNTAAIQMDDASKTITMNSVNEGEIVLEDIVDGQAGYSVELQGDDKSKITINNNINNANISLDNTNLYLGREDVFNQSQTLSLNSGTMYLNNNVIGTMHVPTLNLNGNTDLYVDVDLANESMDRVTADKYNVADDAILNVKDLNLISTTEKENVKILFADEPLANNVTYTGDSPVSYKGTNVIYSPIYKYTVNYGVDENDKQGYFFFNKATAGIGDGSGSDIGGGAAGNISDSFNPSILAPSVAQQAGAYTTQLQTFNYAFQHADTFMNIPYLERISIINANKYAMSPTGDATDVGTFSPLLTKEEDAGFWVKPYASFENIPLKNGPKVSNINYGTLVGYDSQLTPIRNGFERVLTGYIGYNGASQRYSGVDAYQNGGLIGGTATFYKGNFFNATTLSVGATAGDATTMYGSENYTMLLAGIGNKTGYNFEFFDGGLILQPNMLISYTFVNTFDYNNAAGVRIESDPLHAIQLAPGIKLIGNTKNGWQPYIGVNMVWNLLDDSRVTANDVRLPEMSIKPYVQYGAGIQKRFKDRFLAFGQAMIHNGGRNGVSLTAGFRWKVGRE